MKKCINSPIGFLTLYSENGSLTKITFSDEGTDGTDTVIEETEKQLNEYFKGKRKIFTVKINPMGTNFQKKVWNELLNIPYSKTVTYKCIAEKIGNPKGSRAVGNANNKNPIPIIIPCHRVIGSDNKLTGYAGGLDIKNKLLTIEKNIGDKNNESNEF